MPMQPRPIAETSGPPVPKRRILMPSILLIENGQSRTLQDRVVVRDLIGQSRGGQPPRVKIRLDVKTVPDLKTAAVWGLEDLGEVESEHGVEPFVGNQHVLVLDVQRDAARHLQDAMRSADDPFGGNIAVVVDAPDAHERFVGRQLGVWARTAHTDDDLALGRINRERAAKGVEAALGSADDRARFYIA